MLHFCISVPKAILIEEKREQTKWSKSKFPKTILELCFTREDKSHIQPILLTG